MTALKIQLEDAFVIDARFSWFRAPFYLQPVCLYRLRFNCDTTSSVLDFNQCSGDVMFQCGLQVFQDLKRLGKYFYHFYVRCLII